MSFFYLYVQTFTVFCLHSASITYTIHFFFSRLRPEPRYITSCFSRTANQRKHCRGSAQVLRGPPQRSPQVIKGYCGVRLLREPYCIITQSSEPPRCEALNCRQTERLFNVLFLLPLARQVRHQTVAVAVREEGEEQVQRGPLDQQADLLSQCLTMRNHEDLDEILA